MLLAGSRGVPGLAAGAVQSGAVNVTIPATTPLNSYFLLACADDLRQGGGERRDQQLRRLAHRGRDGDEA